MREENILREKYGTETGFRVPEGYFDSLNAKILSELPAYPEEPKALRLSAWQRVKPYVYLAAMFAGIWVMMKVFHTVTMSDSLSLDNPPAAIVEVMSEVPQEMDLIYSSPEFTDVALEEELSGDYQNIEEFKEDFYDL